MPLSSSHVIVDFPPYDTFAIDSDKRGRSMGGVMKKYSAEIVGDKPALPGSEAKFRSYIDNSPDGVFVVDEYGAYVEVNPAASVITGYSEDELLMMAISDLLPPQSMEVAHDHFRTVRETGYSYNEFEFKHKTGKIRWWSVDAVKLSETRYLGFAKDISDRKLIEETQLFLLQCGSAPNGENFFEAVAKYLSKVLEMDYVCIDRLHGDGLVASTLAVCNDGKFEDNVEYTLQDTPCGDVVGNNICIFPREVCQLFPEDEALQSLQAESYVGSTLWSSDMKPIGLIAVIGRRPLANAALAETVLKLVAIRVAGELERQQVEMALQESEQKYRQLFQSMQNGFALHEIIRDEQGIPCDYRFLEINPAFERLTGLKAEHVVGRTVLEVLPGTEPFWIETYGKVALSGESAFFVNYAEQIQRYYEVMAYSPQKLLFATIIADITERKQAEQELQDKNSELESFTYTVSHDLKSPLITIQSYAGMVAHDMDAGNYVRARDDLRRIEGAASKMTALLKDLLELSRIGRQMNPSVRIDMNALVRDVLSQLAGPLGQQEVEIVVGQDLPAIRGDHKRIAEVLQNLIENALKYMGEQPRPRIEIGALGDARECVFRIGDNGKGIDSRYHETIFGLFNKLDAESDGTGVGLALVKRIIEVHGGRVWVESDGYGKGSTFCFTAPRYRHESASGAVQ
jgi:PAS domain S-box-containing protein